MSQDVPIGATQVSLAQLNERSRDIFRQIVESYLATGEPVGSRNISRLITTPLSPASVRNVMSDLEQLGLVYAPHTSAGRLPTETGLRFFVDALMEIGDLGEADRREMEAKVATAGKSMDAVLNEASVMLSGLTRAAGVVLAAKSNVRLKHIEFVRLEAERALVVLVSDDGQVENRIVPVPTDLPTCCEFGGPDLDILYVTSAVLKRPAAHFAGQKNPGGLFAIDVGVKGLTLPAFRG